MSSTVKTLLKYWLSVFALSSADVAIVPLGFSSVGIEPLVFSLDLAYFQKDLGFSFMFLERSSSKLLRNVLVREHSLFFHLVYLTLSN